MEGGARARRAHDQPAVGGPRIAQHLEQVLLKQLRHLRPPPCTYKALTRCGRGHATRATPAKQPARAPRLPLQPGSSCSQALPSHAPFMRQQSCHAAFACETEARERPPSADAQGQPGSAGAPHSRRPGVAPCRQRPRRTGTAACPPRFLGSTPGSLQSPCHSWRQARGGLETPRRGMWMSTACTLARRPPAP